jgi:hypothetical protein
VARLAIRLRGIALATTFLVGISCATAAVSAHAYDDFPGAWESFPPPGHMYGNVALLDAARDRLLVFRAQRRGVWAIASDGTGPWTRIADDPPGTSPIGAHRGIIDPLGDRIIVFGDDGQRTWQLRLDREAAWEELLATGIAPAERQGHSAMYDPVRHRMIVFGGSGLASNDVWALTLDASPEWTQLFPTGTPPAARRSHSAAYDPLNDRMIIFGGYTGSSSLGDTWALSLGASPSWVQVSAGGPIPGARYGHAATLDVEGNRILLFGGYAGFDYYANDLYAYSLASGAWTQLGPSGVPPGGRADHVMVHDPAARRMIVTGGYSRYGLSDVWSLDMHTVQGSWTCWNPSPRQRWASCAVYDPLGDRMLMFGGQIGGGEVVNELWALDATYGSHWESLAAAGGPLPTQFGQRAAYDPARRRMIVFADSGTFLPDREIQPWALSLDGPPTWSKLEPTGSPPPAILLLASAIYDPIGDRMLLYGGNNSGVYNTDVWALDLTDPPAWSLVSTSGPVPPPRAGHSAVYDPIGQRMIVFGGGGPSQSYSDLWALSLDATPTWTQIVPTGHVPPVLQWHSAVWDPLRDRMVVFGGYRSSSPRDEVWEFDFRPAPTCSLLIPQGPPPSARYGHVAVYDPVRDRMLVAAGFTFSEYGVQFAEAWGLDFRAATPPLLYCPVSLATTGGGGGYSVVLENPFPSPQVFEVVLRSERDWPGFPERTYVALNAGASQGVVVGESIPDSAAGPVDLLVEAGFGGDYGALATCVYTYLAETPDAPAVRLALEADAPHPSRAGIAVWLTLPDAAPARLDTYDAAGRLVARQMVETLGAGRHRVRADGGKRPSPGVYFVRLARGREAVTARVIVVN